MFRFLARLVWVFFPFMRVYNVMYLTFGITSFFFSVFLYLTKIYKVPLKYYFYNPLLDFLSISFSTRNVLILFLIWFILTVFFTEYVSYQESKKDFIDETSKNNSSAKKTNYKGYYDHSFLKKKIIIDVLKFRRDNSFDFDDRYKLEPFGLIPINEKNFSLEKKYIVKNVREFSKINLVRYFFDLEYASYFSGVFSWWFLTWLNFYRLFNMVIIFFVIFFGIWIFDNFFFNLTFLRKPGIFYNSFKLSIFQTHLALGLFVCFFSLVILHFSDFRRHYYRDDIIYYDDALDERSEYAAIFLNYVFIIFMMASVLRTKKKIFNTRRQKIFFKKYLKILAYLKKFKIKVALEYNLRTMPQQLKKHFFYDFLGILKWIDEALDSTVFGSINNYFETDYSFLDFVPSYFYVSDVNDDLKFYKRRTIKNKRKRNRKKMMRGHRKKKRRVRWKINFEVPVEDFFKLYSELGVSESKRFYLKRVERRWRQRLRRERRRVKRYMRKFKKKRRRKRRKIKKKSRMRSKKKRRGVTLLLNRINARDEATYDNMMNQLKKKKKEFFLKKLEQKSNFKVLASDHSKRDNFLVKRFYRNFFKPRKVNNFLNFNSAITIDRVKASKTKKFKFLKKKLFFSTPSVYLKKKSIFKLNRRRNIFSKYLGKFLNWGIGKINNFIRYLNTENSEPWYFLRHDRPERKIYRRKKRKTRWRKRLRRSSVKKIKRFTKKKRKKRRKRRKKLRKKRRSKGQRHWRRAMSRPRRQTTYIFKKFKRKVRNWRIKIRKFMNRYHNSLIDSTPYLGFDGKKKKKYKLFREVKLKNFYEYAQSVPFLKFFLNIFIHLKKISLSNFFSFEIFFRYKKLQNGKAEFTFNEFVEYASKFEKFYNSSDFFYFLKSVGWKKKNISKSEKFYLKNIFCLCKGDMVEFKNAISNRVNYIIAVEKLFNLYGNDSYGVYKSKDAYAFYKNKLKLDLYLNNEFFQKLSEVPPIKNPFDLETNYSRYNKASWWYKLLFENILGFDDGPYRKFLAQRDLENLKTKNLNLDDFNKNYFEKKYSEDESSHYFFLGPQGLSDLMRIFFYKKFIEAFFTKKK